MILDAVTFDLGCVRSPMFAFPDVSGLAPLTLPDEFLRGQNHQPQQGIPSDSVRRFETAMSAEQQIPPAVVESLMAHVIPESRKIEGESQKAAADTVAKPVEGPIVATVERPVASVPVERHAVEIVTTIAHESSAAHPVDEKTPAATLVSVDKSVVPAVEAPKTVEVERPVVATTDNPTIVTLEKPVVTVAGKPVIPAADRSTVAPIEVSTAATVEVPTAATIETPMSATIEKTVTVVPPSAHIVVPAGVENLNSRVDVEEQPVAANVIPTTPTAPSAKPVAMVEMPAAVDKTAGALIEHAAEGAAVATANAAIIESPVARPVDEKPVAASPEQVTRQVTAATPVESAVVIGKAVVPSADRPVASVVEQPVAVMAEVPAVATTEKPEAVVSSAAPAVAPSVLENPVVNLGDAEIRPVFAGNTPVEPAAKPVASVETPVTAVTAGVNVIVEKAHVVSVERPVAEKISNPMVAAVEKPEEKAVAAAAHVVVPAAVEASAPHAIPAAPEGAAVSAASARTEVIVETVNQIVEAVVGQILVTPGITQGECEIKIRLKPTVLDGSEVTMSAKDGTLTVNITPATQEASAAAAAALPRLEIALAEHAPAFHRVSVALAAKKGKDNEAV